MARKGFTAYACGVLGLNLAVILWGAYVRATGSGAGCGRHWPLCNGEVLPRSARIETVIELTHRVTSGMALIAVAVMVVWAVRAYPRGHRVRLAAGLSFLFIVIEALIGAGLVLLELVAANASMARAYWMVAHLLNTFALVALLTLTAWWGSGAPAARLRGAAGPAALLGMAIAGVMLVGATGAVAALGDTLFPAQTLSEGIRESFSRESHPLVRLRKLHPIVAVVVGAGVVVAARVAARLRPAPVTTRLATLLVVLYAIQLLAGAVNVVLLAPVWLQLVHLLLAQLVWISLVVLTAAALSTSGAGARPVRPAPRVAPV